MTRTSAGIKPRTLPPRAKAVLKGLALPVIFVIAMEVWARAAQIDSFSLAAPSDIAGSFIEALLNGEFLLATVQTLHAILIAMVCSTILGTLVGVALGLVPAVNRLVNLAIELIRPVPAIALLPVIILFAGMSLKTEILVIFFGTFWPVLLFARAATANVPRQLLEVSRLLDLSGPAQLIRVILPSIIPQLFVGFRLALGISLVVAITVELTGNPNGLGHGMIVAQNALNPALMLAYVVWIGLIGWALGAVTLFLQGRLFARFDVKENAR